MRCVYILSHCVSYTINTLTESDKMRRGQKNYGAYFKKATESSVYWDAAVLQYMQDGSFCLSFVCIRVLQYGKIIQTARKG